MQNSLKWSPEQKKRAHSRIFEDLMKRRRLTETQIISKLGDEGPKAQSTINRWKTLDVRPNRHTYLDLLKNIFQLEYNQIDAMLWLSGMPPLLRKETASVFGSNDIFHEKTENELGIESYKMLISVIGNDLGLPAPYGDMNMTGNTTGKDFTFNVEMSGKKIIVRINDLPLELQGLYWPLYSQPLVWVVLQDKHHHYYLQSPPVNFLPDGRWIADNIIPGNGIITIHFVAVGAVGHASFMDKVRRKEWGGFSNLPADGKIIKSVPLDLKIK